MSPIRVPHYRHNEGEFYVQVRLAGRLRNKPPAQQTPNVPGELLCDMATRQKVPAACTMLVQMSVRVTLFGAPPQKDFEARLQKNQKAFAYGTEAGSGSHLANQEASGAGKAYAYGTGAGGRSHLAKLRDGARHCAELYAALRDGARHCNSGLSLPFLTRWRATL